MVTTTVARMLSVLTPQSCLTAPAMRVSREMGKSALVSCARSVSSL